MREVYEQMLRDHVLEDLWHNKYLFENLEEGFDMEDFRTHVITQAFSSIEEELSCTYKWRVVGDYFILVVGLGNSTNALKWVSIITFTEEDGVMEKIGEKKVSHMWMREVFNREVQRIMNGNKELEDY